MSEYKRIYLQPECCADPDVGRLWCQNDEPQACPDGEKWTPYVLASEYDSLQSEVERLTAQAEKAEQECRDRIKADRLYCMKHGDKAAQEMAERLEKAEARVKELAKLIGAGDRLCYELESWLATEHDKESQRAINIWKRLRHPSDEAEKAVGG